MGAHGRPENQPETESRLTELASKSGRATGDLVEVALCGYLREVAEVREMLDGRYDDIKSGRVEPIAMLGNASSGRTDGFVSNGRTTTHIAGHPDTIFARPQLVLTHVHRGKHPTREDLQRLGIQS